MRHHITASDIAPQLYLAPALSELHSAKKITQQFSRKPSRIDTFINIDAIIAEHCKDPELKALYERKEMILDIAQMVVTIRKKLGLTQAELALKAQTTQPVIARLEGGHSRRMPSLDLLAKIASATGCILKIGFDKE